MRVTAMNETLLEPGSPRDGQRRGASTSSGQNSEPAAVKAVQRAIDILSCFTRETPEKGVSEICAETGLSKGAVHRLLMALQSRACVEQDSATGKYRLGMKLLELGGVVRGQMRYLEKAVPHLRQFVRETDETVVVVALDGESHICTLVVESPRAVRVATNIGVRRLPYFGAGGQVLLAWQPDDEVDRLLPPDKLEAFTIWSLTDPIDYRRRLATVRSQGYAVDRGESFPDVTGLGAPIFGHDGRVVAAAVMVAPSHRVPDDRIPPLLERLLVATGVISAELGAPSHVLDGNLLSGASRSFESSQLTVHPSV